VRSWLGFVGHVTEEVVEAAVPLLGLPAVEFNPLVNQSVE
jgi:hypothetical protein